VKTNRISDGEITQISQHKTRRIIYTGNLMMAVWDFSDGPWCDPEPYHAHPHEQIVYLAEGEILFFVGEESCRLTTGDTVAVPGNQPHTIQILTSTVRLIDTWTPVREEFL
jgi:quercetin dioxygenase-like cupin family protein